MIGQNPIVPPNPMGAMPNIMEMMKDDMADFDKSPEDGMEGEYFLRRNTSNFLFGFVVW
jgi:hypothetical protein